MSMSPDHAQREALAAEVYDLFAQQEFAAAAALLRQRLAGDRAGDPVATALLALALQFSGDAERALATARAAVHGGVGVAFTHYALALVLNEAGQLHEALVSIGEAIRLDASVAQYHAEMGGLYLQLRRWVEAAAAGERGLAIAVHSEECWRVVARARQELASQATAADRLGSEQEDEIAALNLEQGLAALKTRQPLAAMQNLQQALLFRPELLPALWGVTQAFRQAAPLRGRLLDWLLRLSMAPWWLRALVMIVGSVMVPVATFCLSDAASLLMWALGVGGCLLAGLVWLARPLFHLLVRFSALGRRYLGRRQMQQANALGLLLLVAGVWATAGLVWRDAQCLLNATVAAVLSVPVTNVYQCGRGRRRQWLIGTLALLLGLAAVVAMLGGAPWRHTLISLLGLLMVGCLAHTGLTAAFAAQEAPLPLAVPDGGERPAAPADGGRD